MNWSTRLRRWVRIRMPPVREASTKPTAATVLPAPVACSNQKRRSAPGSSGASSITSSSSSSASSQSSGLLVASVPRLLVEPSSPSSRRSPSSSAAPPSPAPRARAVAVRPSTRCRSIRSRPRRSARPACPRARRPGARRAPRRRPASARSSSEQPLEPEQQRVVAAPLDRGASCPARSRRAPRRAPGAGRCPGAASVGAALALEQDRSRANSRAFDVGPSGCHLSPRLAAACLIGHRKRGVCGPPLTADPDGTPAQGAQGRAPGIKQPPAGSASPAVQDFGDR